MADSKLVNYVAYTNNCSIGRGGHKVAHIAIHHMAGNLTVAECGNVFKNVETSAHYGIDNNGNIGQYVKESNTAWALGNYNQNQCSINIELANDGGANTDWHVSDLVIERCIDLVYDIAKRLGWTYCDYTGDETGDIIAHRFIVATACPGNYMMKNNKLGYIAHEVDKRLKGNNKPAPKPSKPAVSNPAKLKVDGWIGPLAVKALQKVLGAPYQDGIISGQLSSTEYCHLNITNSAIDYDGESSPLIRSLQKYLNKNIGAKLNVDGYLGANTVKALQRYLNKAIGAGLSVDGIIGANTAMALQRWLNTKI